VTLTQYRSLTKDVYETGEKYNWHPDVPVVRINWYMAAKYCNLLSKEEGIDERQWCYETDAKGEVTKLKAEYLRLTGYRLPTEAEIEYATRARAVTSRYFGETDELLGNYAWFMKNSNELIWPVGTKKPNDFGLFDVQGNCFTWCQESYADYPSVKGDGAVGDKEGKLEVIATERRVLRGGSFDDPALNTRSANRFDNVPSNRNYDFGFRLVRTFPFDP
jgi:formylglycine-generating enzyme required for sulfatase activity